MIALQPCNEIWFRETIRMETIFDRFVQKSQTGLTALALAPLVGLEKKKVTND
jgi:hypothetical protein